MPPGKDRICLEPDGAFEGVFLEVVEDTGKPYIYLATWVWCFFCKPIAGRFVVAYIQNQEEHHRTVTYEEEYRSFLNGYLVAFDERYVWD
jgi:hypothetical protein